MRKRLVPKNNTFRSLIKLIYLYFLKSLLQEEDTLTNFMVYFKKPHETKIME